MRRTKQSVALGRRLGASPEARERLRAADAEAVWTGTCQYCREELKGTLKQLREHTCPQWEAKRGA